MHWEEESAKDVKKIIMEAWELVQWVYLSTFSSFSTVLVDVMEINL